MIQFKQLSHYYGQRVLFDNADSTILSKHKVGLVGRNGSGKSTLFKFILGQMEPCEGHVELPNGLEIAHLEQEVPDVDDSALEYVVQGDKPLADIETALTIAEKNEDFDKMMRLHEQLSNIDGYTARARAAKLLIGLGFEHDSHENSVKSFSGGWRMRLNLARTLMCRSDLMLLDEPTNHLDLDAIFWLEQWLCKYPGTLILISHDRDFVDKVVDHIAHIRHKKISLYTGNYSAFEKLLAEKIHLQQAEYDKQQAKIAHMMKYVNRFAAKASKAKQAQSRLKAIARLPQLEAVQRESEYHFQFFEINKCPSPIVHLHRASSGYDGEIVLHRVDAHIAPGQRIGLLGENGAGKSTLIKMLIGDLPLMKGELQMVDKSHIGYFAQHQFEQIRLDQNPLQQMQALAPKTPEKELRKYLGGFAFSQDLAITPVEKCSGGEKARLILAMLVWQRPALLLLDEPTNHLDMDMRNALIVALQHYEGAIVAVSHDRHLLRMISNEFWLVEDGTVSEFDGDIQDYGTRRA